MKGSNRQTNNTKGKMNRKNWTTKVERSAEGISKLEPSDAVWAKIQSTIGKTRDITFTRSQVYAIAASLLVLISLNVSLLASSNVQTKDKEVSILKEQVGGTSVDNIYTEL